MNVEVFFYSTLSVFTIILIMIGYYYYKKKLSKEEYWLAGRKLTLIDVTLSTAATFNGSVNYLGLIGVYFVFGLSGLWHGFFLIFGITLWGLFASKTVSRDKIYTINDIFENRCGQNVRRMISFFYLIRNLMIIIIELIGCGLVLNLLVHIDFPIAVLVSGILILSYTLLGGINSVIKTDYIQLVLILFLSGLFYIITFQYIDLSSISPNLLNPLNIDPGVFITLALTAIPLAWTTAPLYDRAASAKDTKTAYRGITIGSLLLFIPFISMVLFGLTIRSVGLSDVNSEVAGLIFIINYLPTPIVALSTLAIFAAIISTADSFLVSSGVIIGHDLFFLKSKRSSDRLIIIYSQIGMILITIISVSFAIFFNTVFSTFLLFMEIMVATLFVPTIVGLYFPDKLSKIAVTISSLSGFIITIIWAIQFVDSVFNPIIIGISVSLFGYLIGYTLDNNYSFRNTIKIVKK